MRGTGGHSRIQCLSDDVLSDFIAGRLETPELQQRVVGHLEQCESCETRLNALPRDGIGGLPHEAGAVEGRTGSDRWPLDLSLTSTTRSLAADDSSKATDPSDAAAAESTEELPERIGDYLIVQLLGKGGFGHVYLARDLPNQRRVAIKVPRPDRPFTRERRESFLNDARTIAALDHPNIVRLLDYPQLDDGRCCLVMEYIEGTNLADVLRREKLAPRRSAEIAAGIAEALDYAHQRNIWHRDVKPDNILLDRTGKPHLTDFGLALREEQQHRRANELAGTYRYMSPEQISGRSHHLDGRSDIWSLGVILYEMLTQQLPFRGASYAELRDDISLRTHRAPSSLEGSIPERLEAICNRCLRKSPDERYSTASQLAADLRRAIGADHHVVARWVAAAVVLLLACAVAVGVGAYSSRESSAVGARTAGTATERRAARRAADRQAPLVGEDDERAEVPPAADARWIAILDRQPTRVAFPMIGFNTFKADTENEELSVRHDTDRGLLSCGELPVSSFTVRFVVTIEDWRGAAGFFWALQLDRQAFPKTRHRCVGLMLRKQGNELLATVEELAFRESPLDKSQLLCDESHEVSRGSCPLPAESSLGVQLTVQRGEVRDLRIDGDAVALESSRTSSPFVAEAPAEFGFVSFNSDAGFENASLTQFSEEQHDE